MTEQPNTAAIRAAYNPFLDPKCVIALCDALDAARAERDAHDDVAFRYFKKATASRCRAEAAEERIAAALVICDLVPTIVARRIRHALTEGTGQS